MRRWAVLGGVAAAAASLGAFASWGLGHRSVARHVDAYRDHWAAPPEGQHGALRYVALGDSAAQGVGASDVSRGYVPLLAERLRDATGRDVIVTNLSVSGATSDDVVRDQLPLLSALDFEPDLVTLDIGGNDVVFPQHNVETFERSLTTILDALPVGSFVADVPWFPLPVWGPMSRRMAASASRLAEDRGHHVVHLHRISRETGLRYHLYTAQDRFHPNDLGYQGWALAFWSAIERSGTLDRLTA